MGFRTQRDVERLALPPGKAEAFVFDVRSIGLSVRLQRTGKPAFVVWFTAPGGKRKRLTLGSTAALRLDDARAKAAGVIEAARSGKDPAAEREKARAQARAETTLAQLFQLYLAQHAEKRLRERTLVEVRRALLVRMAPLHALPLRSISRRHVSDRLLAIAKENGPTTANRARAYVSAAFSWGMRAGIAEANPTIGTIKPHQERARDRVLSHDELRAIWQATSSGSAYDQIVRLLLLLGQRRDEVGGLKWREIEKSTWSLPAERTKNRRGHVVPLPRQAREILQSIPQRGEYVFGRKAGFSGWSQSKKRLDERLAKAGAMTAPWTLHDVRRSVVSHMAEHGIAAPHVIEVIVNHVSGHKASVAGIYNRAQYASEKERALQAWADWLEILVKDKAEHGNVVPLAAGA